MYNDTGYVLYTKTIVTFCFFMFFILRPLWPYLVHRNFEVPVLSEEVRKLIYDTELEKYTRLTWKLKYIFNSVSKFVSGPTRDKDAHLLSFPPYIFLLYSWWTVCVAFEAWFDRIFVD